ncbi:hypothetical protein Vadar_005104 [Vaccinium darrowii]|uniref:Uncharacterized protein n=1 Tax=Vaccinium darrowii TaxID=229202 RepID=A0ACB7WY44_9ERIC|nr:hypothetical protein Vadar_005104 [Vaccinium darrowii]
MVLDSPRMPQDVFRNYSEPSKREQSKLEKTISQQWEPDVACMMAVSDAVDFLEANSGEVQETTVAHSTHSDSALKGNLCGRIETLLPVLALHFFQKHLKIDPSDRANLAIRTMIINGEVLLLRVEHPFVKLIVSLLGVRDAKYASDLLTRAGITDSKIAST